MFKGLLSTGKALWISQMIAGIINEILNCSFVASRYNCWALASRIMKDYYNMAGWMSSCKLVQQKKVLLSGFCCQICISKSNFEVSMGLLYCMTL